MTWYAWVMIGWIVFGLGCAANFAADRRSITYTPKLWVALAISAGLQVWGIVSLAT